MNGTKGINRHYMQGLIDIVWIEFANIKVGLTEQATMQHLNTPLG